MPKINSEILKWARETAGLDVDEACARLRLRSTKGLSPRDRLEALESGECDPSRTLLATMAKQYHRPLLVFYLPAPPRKADRGQDFRVLPEDYPKTDDALLDALLRDIQARQSTVRALMEEEDEAVGVPFIGAAKMGDGGASLVERIRSILLFDPESFSSEPNPTAAFARLRSAAEHAGVFVLLIGDLGSYHTRMDVKTFRGVALADKTAPFIVINDGDARSAWSFTLIHELAHLCLGQTGVSGAWAELKIEKFCNDVASEFLLPKSELDSLQLPSTGDTGPIRQRIAEFARGRNLSSAMVAYRLYRRGKITELQWAQLRDEFRELWEQRASARRERNKETQGGPNYYVVRQHRVGAHLIRFVARMLHAGALTTTKAGRLLGVRPSNVQRLLQATS